MAWPPLRGKGVGAVTGTIKGGYKAITGAMTRDVYVKGSDTPILRAAYMKAGKYFDAETGELIRKFADIKGPVVDDNNNEVLTQADYDAGLVDRSGVSLSDVISFATAPIRGAWSLQTAAISGAWKAAGAAKDRLSELASFDPRCLSEGGRGTTFEGANPEERWLLLEGDR